MTVKESAERAATLAGTKLHEAGDAARLGLDKARAKASEGIDGFPVAALVGGIVAGALVGALLPKTRAEEDLLGGIGGEINDRARSAFSAAREAGTGKLDELGVSTDAAGKQVGRLIESLAAVAESAGTAAVDAIKQKS